MLAVFVAVIPSRPFAVGFSGSHPDFGRLAALPSQTKAFLSDRSFPIAHPPCGGGGQALHGDGGGDLGAVPLAPCEGGRHRGGDHPHRGEALQPRDPGGPPARGGLFQYYSSCSYFDLLCSTGIFPKQTFRFMGSTWKGGRARAGVRG